MPKNLIVCCDGTWNNQENEQNGVNIPTNVVKLYHALAEKDVNGITQEKYYHPGVGGENLGWINLFLGGTFGVGISRHIQSAYHWLASHYEDGDNIWLFGFSRGAFTVRSLAEFIGKGLLDLRKIQYDNRSWNLVKKAYEEAYRQGKRIKEITMADCPLFQNGAPINICFLGVWDTVGALGIPDNFGVLNLFDKRKNWQFHDLKLGVHVKHARHAMSIDEQRACFTVTRWDDADTHADAKEIWFPGVHSDVGGGYVESGLSNIALKWMIDESKEFGLKFREELEIKTDSCGALHDSYQSVFAKMPSRPRNYPAIKKENQKIFHPSVFERQDKSPLECPLYHPCRPLEIGQFCSIEIFASNPWNKTDLYLEVGQQYQFSARGSWLNGKESYDWQGNSERYTIRDFIHFAASCLGKLEKGFKFFTHNPAVDFWGTKRAEEYGWAVMIGAIANDGNTDNAVKNDGSSSAHQYLKLSQYETTPFTVTKSGYLYCFSNDAWRFYKNNHGCIELTVTRVK